MTKTIEQRLSRVEERIEVISAYQDECDKLHKEMREHNKRSDDAINHNSEASMMATRAVNELNITLCKLIEKVEKNHDPVVEWWRPIMEIGNDLKSAYRINKSIILWVSGALAIVAGIVISIRTIF